MVADAQIPPIDKACGEGLMPDSLAELKRLGVEVTGGRPFSGIHFANRNRRHEDLASAEFAHGKGIGIRRLELHRCLIERAEAIGVRFRWGMPAHFGSDGKITLSGEEFKHRYLIGADGEASRVRRWAGLDEGSLRSQRFGFRRHYRVRPWSDHVEIHWGQSGQAYVTPIGEDEVCVVAITRWRGLNFDSILQEIPFLREILSGRPTVGRDRGALTATRKLRRVVRRNIALIGDASGSADAITGEGMAMAFRQALLLGKALEREAIEEYQAGHGAILERPQRMAAMMLALDRWHWLRDSVVCSLANDPETFSRLLAVHLGETSLPSFIVGRGLRLGWGILSSSIPSSSRQIASERCDHAADDGSEETSILRSA